MYVFPFILKISFVSWSIRIIKSQIHHFGNKKKTIDKQMCIKFHIFHINYLLCAYSNGIFIKFIAVWLRNDKRHALNILCCIFISILPLFNFFFCFWQYAKLLTTSIFLYLKYESIFNIFIFYFVYLFCQSLRWQTALEKSEAKKWHNENLFAVSMKSKTLLEYEAIKSKSVFFALKLNAQKKCNWFLVFLLKFIAWKRTKKKARTKNVRMAYQLINHQFLKGRTVKKIGHGFLTILNACDFLLVWFFSSFLFILILD